MFEDIKKLDARDKLTKSQTVELLEAYDRECFNADTSVSKMNRELNYNSHQITKWKEGTNTPFKYTIDRMIEFIESKKEKFPLTHNINASVYKATTYTETLKPEHVQMLPCFENVTENLLRKLTSDISLDSLDMSEMLYLMHKLDKNMLEDEMQEPLRKLMMKAVLVIGQDKMNASYDAYKSLLNIHDTTASTIEAVNVPHKKDVPEPCIRPIDRGTFVHVADSPTPNGGSTAAYPKAWLVTKARQEARKFGYDSGLMNRPEINFRFTNEDIVSVAVCHMLGYASFLYKQLYKEIMYVNIDTKLFRNQVLCEVKEKPLKIAYHPAPNGNAIVNPETTVVVNHSDTGREVIKSVLAFLGIDLYPNVEELEVIDAIWDSYKSIIVN